MRIKKGRQKEIKRKERNNMKTTIKKLKIKLLSHRIAIGIIGVFALSLGVYAFSGTGSVVIEGDWTGDKIEATSVEQMQDLGAFPGPDIYGELFVHGAFSQGGKTRATSTDDTSATLLASDFDEENIIEFTPNVTGITLTLPATSTMWGIVPEQGDMRRIYIRNSTTTAGATFTLAAGAGWDLQAATSTALVYPDDFTVVEFYREDAGGDVGGYYGIGY